MALKKGHKHVDQSGLVYLPYLHEWSARSHNLVQLCAHMSSVFGAEPPVSFDRAYYALWDPCTAIEQKRRGPHRSVRVHHGIVHAIYVRVLHLLVASEPDIARHSPSLNL